MIQPIVHKSVYKEVFYKIINLIKTREFSNGDKLPGELELSESFRVSRNSVREALKSLEILGIISSKSGIGTIVSENATRNIGYFDMITSIDDKNIIPDMWETRLIVEPQLTYKAIERADSEDIRKITEQAELSKNRVAGKKTVNWDDGIEFHNVIYSISKNSLLKGFLEATLNELSLTRMDYYLHVKQETLMKDIEEHLEIAKCFAEKDPERGKLLMKKHLEKAYKKVIDQTAQ